MGSWRFLRFSYFFFFLLSISLYASAQKGSIEGRVIDAGTGDPLIGATVAVQDELLGTATDEKGRFSFTRVDTGTYFLVARHLGYQKQVRQVRVRSGDTVNPDFGLVQTDLEKEAIQIRGKKKEHELAEPMPKTRIGPEKIRELGKINTAEILDDVPGVSVARNGNWGSKPVFQGMTDDRVVTFIDGFKVTQSCPMGMDACAASVDPGMIEGMDVQVGSGGAEYGSGNIGGAMHIQTLEGSYAREDTFRADLTLAPSYESVSNSRSGMLSLQGGKRKFDFALSGGMSRHDNYRYPSGNAYEPFPSKELPFSGFDSKWLHFKGRYRPSPGHEISLIGQLYRADSIGWPSRMAPTIIPRERRDLYGIRYKYEKPRSQRDSGGLRFQKLKADLGYQPMFHDMVNRLEDSVNTRYKGLSESENFQGSLKGYFLLGKSHRLTLGTEHWLWHMHAERQVITEGGRSPFSPILDQGKLREHGIFLLDRIEVTEDLDLDLGVRYNHTVSDAASLPHAGSDDPDLHQVNDAFTWNLAPNFQFNDHLSLDAALVKGFNAATPVDRFISAPMLDGYYHYGEPSIKAETNLSKRIGLKAMYDGWNARIEGFHNGFENLIERRVDPSSKSPITGLRGVRRARNIRKGRIMGANARVAFFLSSSIEFKMKAAYQYGTDGDGNPLPNIAPFRFSPELRYENRDKGWKLVLQSDLVAAQDRFAPEYAEIRTPGYAIFNLRAGWEATESLSINLNLDNFTNQRYRRHLSDAQVPEPGANISLRLRYEIPLINKAPQPDLGEAQKVLLKVDGMACQYCVNTVRERLKALPDVIQVTVHLKEGEARAIVKKGASLEALVQAIQRAGFETEILSVEDYSGKAE